MLYKNKLWIEDIDKVSENIPDLEQFEGKSILITGAAGLICSSVVDILLRYNEKHSNKIKIYVAGRSIEKMTARFRDLNSDPVFTFIYYDASKADNHLTVHADYIIHGASNAYPALVMKEPVETMLSNILGMNYLLDYARECNTSRILYISSSEVYGRKERTDSYKEDEYGFIDLLNPRSAYALGKQSAEALCIAYASEHQIESVIVRPGHIYGPTATEYDTRVSSAWAYDAARGRDIVMKSDGSQIRSYCYCLDCASAILTVLLRGENACAYNISNPESIINIRRLAEILAGVAGVELRMNAPSEEERKSFNPMNNSSLEANRLLDLGWKGCFDAETGLAHTVRILKESVISD